MTKNNRDINNMTILAKPLARAIIWGGNPAAKAINRASWLAGKVGTRIAPHRYQIGWTREDIADILRHQGFTVGWTKHESRDDSAWNDLRPNIVYNKEGRLYFGPLGRMIRILRPFDSSESFSRRYELDMSGVLKDLAKKLPEAKAHDINVLEKYGIMLEEMHLLYSALLTALIDKLPKETLEDIDKFKAYCDLMKSFRERTSSTSLDFHIARLIEALPEGLVADISKLRQIVEVGLKAHERGWDDAAAETLYDAIKIFIKTLPPPALKSDRFAGFLSCDNDRDFGILTDNLICFLALYNDFKVILLTGENDLDNALLRKKLVDMLGRAVLNRDSLNAILNVPPGMLMEAGRLRRVLDIVKETAKAGNKDSHRRKVFNEVNLCIYSALIEIEKKMSSEAGTNAPFILEDHMNILLEAREKVRIKLLESKLEPERNSFLWSSLVELINLMGRKNIANMEEFKKLLDHIIWAYGRQMEDMPALEFSLELIARLQCLEKCFPKDISASTERFKIYQDIIGEYCDKLRKTTGSAKAALKFLHSLSVFLKQAPAELFEQERFARFFNCSTETEIMALADIMTCYSVLAEDYEKKIAIKTNDLDWIVLRGKLIAAVKGINLNFSLEGLWNIPTAFLMEIGFAEKVVRNIREVIPNFPENLPYYSFVGFISSIIKLRENWLWEAHLSSDETISRIFDVLGKYGSIEAYYRKEKAKLLAELKKAGFNIDHLLGGAEVLSRDLGGREDKADTVTQLNDRFRELMRRMLGTKEKDPEKYFKFNQNPGKLFKVLNLKTALDGNREAIEKAARSLLQMIEEERKKNKDRALEDWHDRLSGMLGEIKYGESGIVIRSMRAVRSGKLVPEILFDNQRLGCCIFLPKGEEKREIPLIVLDPKTPLLEMWINGYDEFMGVVTQYLGKNKNGEPVVFIDTVENSHLIYGAMGRNHALRFELDAMVLDAHRMGSRELALFSKAEFGTTVEFVNFVKGLGGGYEGLIKHVPDYYFEAVDHDDRIGLRDSIGWEHHYTDAFGLHKEIKGTTSCLVIDVPEYMKRVLKIGRSNNIPANNFKIETLTSLDDRIITQLMAVEEEAFPAYLRYSASHFKSLSSEKNFNVVTVKNEKGEFIGFALGYTHRSRPNEMFLDVMALNNKGRGLGLGKICIDQLSQIAIGLGCKKMTLACREKDVDGRKLVKYYESFGFVIVSGDQFGAFMEKDLRR